MDTVLSYHWEHVGSVAIWQNSFEALNRWAGLLKSEVFSFEEALTDQVSVRFAWRFTSL